MVDNCEIEFNKAMQDPTPDSADLVKQLNAIAMRRFNEDGSKSFNYYFSQALDEAIAEQEEAARRASAGILATQKARSEMVANFRSFKEGEGIGADVAVSRTVEAAGNSVESEVALAKGAFSEELKEKDLDSYYVSLRKNDTEQLNVLKEVGQINSKNGQPGITGSKQALQVAQIYQRHLNALRARQKDLGIRVDDLEGRMLRQVWDADSLRRYGTKQQFVEDIAPRVNKARTFGRSNATDAEVREMVEDFYDLVVKGELDDIPVTARSLVRERETFASRQTKNRVIHLSSAEDTLYVMKTFGDGDVGASMYGSLVNAARKTRISEVFGLNPRQTLAQLRRVAARDATPEEAGQIQTPSLSHMLRHGSVDAMMEIIDGSFDRSSSPSLAMVSHMLGNFTRAGFLQMAILSSIPDLATGGRAAARIGASTGANVKARMDWAMDGLPPELHRSVMGAVETANAYNVGALTQRISGKGTLVKLTNLSTEVSNATMKYSGMNMWTSHNKGTASVMIRSVLGNELNKPLDQLEASLQGTLRRARIGEGDWAKLSDIPGAVLELGEGRRILDIEAINKADAALGRKMRDAVFSFVNDAVPTPGIRERAILTQGTRAGTITGTMARFTSALLGYPLSFMTRQMAREAEVGGAKGIAGQAKLAAAVTFAGYLAVMVRDAAQGKTRDYLSDDLEIQREIFLEALVRGGAGGLIAGEVLNTIRFGETAGGLLSGAPTAYFDGIVDGLVNSGSQLSQGEVDSAMSEFIKTTRRYAPFASLPQTKLLVDMMVYEPLMEMVDPAALDRQRNDWYRKTGGEFILD